MIDRAELEAIYLCLRHCQGEYYQEGVLNLIDISVVEKILDRWETLRDHLSSTEPKDEGIIQADEVTLEFFRKYLEMPKATLEEMCREIIRLKEPKDTSQSVGEEDIFQWLGQVDMDIYVDQGTSRRHKFAEALLAKYNISRK